MTNVIFVIVIKRLKISEVYAKPPGLCTILLNMF